jgi:large subunit ribosomal protein L13
MKRNKTYMAKPADMKPDWHLIDATGQTLGRLATRISRTLQGKDKPIYTPHTLTGDFIVVVNASKVRVTGRKAIQKVYYRHSGYVGNLKTVVLRDLLDTHPERVVQLAVRGMLPKTKLGRDMLSRLKVYGGDSHPHQAQIAAPPSPERGESAAIANGDSEGR